MILLKKTVSWRDIFAGCFAVDFDSLTERQIRFSSACESDIIRNSLWVNQVAKGDGKLDEILWGYLSDE
jgi:hypothetical protein